MGRTNDLGVDCISRQGVLNAIDAKAWEFCDYLISKGRNDEQKPVLHFADNLRKCVREALPSVTPQEPILDKIRAEIEYAMKYQYAIGEEQYAEGFEKSLEIIDKYKAESEDKE